MRWFTVMSFAAVLAASVSLAAETSLPAPDLVLWPAGVKPYTQIKEFTTNGCEVLEGCAIPGTRRLLRFHIFTRNQGTADLVLGAPQGNPLFEYASCHGHYHFRNFVIARLFDSNNLQVASAAKIGFCLLDDARWDPNAPTQPIYHCQFQGIQRGWDDFYWANLACQFIDITGLPGGEYTLELEVDPDNRLHESNKNNNIIRLPTVIPEPCGEPVANDNFDAPTQITDARVLLQSSSSCASLEPGEVGIPFEELGRSVWFRWVAPFTGPTAISTDGSTFNTLLSVYTGDALNALTIIGEDDNGGYGYNALVRFNATNGTAYRIKVDGYLGVGGDYTLNIIPSTNDHFQNCAPLVGAAGLIRDYNLSATAQPGEPAHAGNRAIHSIWFCWIAPFTGPVTFDTSIIAGAYFDTVLAVYTGVNLTALTVVATNDNYAAPWVTSRVTFNAVSNTLYRIAVDGRGGAVGITILRWGPPLRLATSNISNDDLQLSVLGAPGDQYAIETSDDLKQWSVWKRPFNTNGTTFLHAPFTTVPQQFYRLYLE
jgi:hypothetical protein